jgi:geranylgeranyl diphosphate synthase type II
LTPSGDDQEHRFAERYGVLKRRSDDALKAFLAESLQGVDGCESRLKEAAWYAAFSGGQRLRPVLLQEACEVLGGHSDDALPLACAIELIHSYSLVHDDLPSMDDDDFRRGRLSVHRVFGEGVAVLVGDLLLTLAFEATTKIPLSLGLDFRSILGEITKSIGYHGMLGGQAEDISFAAALRRGESLCGRPNTEALRTVLRRICRLKTGRLFEASLVLGGLVAGAGSDILSSIRRYGSSFGMAYQIADDICDCDPDSVDFSEPNYAEILGLSRATKDFSDEIKECIEAVESFGERGWFLQGLAKRVSERVNHAKRFGG